MGDSGRVEAVGGRVRDARVIETTRLAFPDMEARPARPELDDTEVTEDGADDC